MIWMNELTMYQMSRKQCTKNEKNGHNLIGPADAHEGNIVHDSIFIFWYTFFLSSKLLFDKVQFKY